MKPEVATPTRLALRIFPMEGFQGGPSQRTRELVSYLPAALGKAFAAVHEDNVGLTGSAGEAQTHGPQGKDDEHSGA